MVYLKPVFTATNSQGIAESIGGRLPGGRVPGCMFWPVLWSIPMVKTGGLLWDVYRSFQTMRIARFRLSFFPQRKGINAPSLSPELSLVGCSENPFSQGPYRGFLGKESHSPWSVSPSFDRVLRAQETSAKIIPESGRKMVRLW